MSCGTPRFWTLSLKMSLVTDLAKLGCSFLYAAHLFAFDSLSAQSHLATMWYSLSAKMMGVCVYRNLLLIIISDRLDYRKFAAWKFCLVTTFWRGIGPWRITHLSCICIILFLGCGSWFIIIQCNGDDFIRIFVYEGKSNKCNRKQMKTGYVGFSWIYKKL